MDLSKKSLRFKHAQQSCLLMQNASLKVGKLSTYTNHFLKMENHTKNTKYRYMSLVN